VTSIGPTESVKLDGQLALFPALESGLYEVAGTFTITNGRKFVTPTGFTTFTNSGVITVGPSSTLSVAGKLNNATGRIVLDGGLFVMDYDWKLAPSEIDAVRGELRKGYAGGSWAGASGIVSLQAAADPQHRTAMGYGEAARVFGLGASQVTSYGGLNVDATAVVTKYTYFGDANLNGKVDLDDYALIDRGFARHVADAHWMDGDFNYDGVVDGGDYLLMDRVFILQGGKLEPGVLAGREAVFGEGYVGALLAGVPEPGGLAVMVGAAFGVSRRARRRPVEK
jgi:hypothetical protein